MCFYIASVSQVNVKTLKTIFEQWSELQVAKNLIVHVLSSSYKVSRFELLREKKATQQWFFRVSNDILLKQIGVHHERVYTDNVLSKFWLVRSLSFQHHSKFIANIATEKMSQVCTKVCKTRSFISKINLSFLRSSRRSNCDTTFAVIVSFLNESAHGFNKIRNGRVETRFQIVKIRRFRNFFFSKRINFPSVTFWYIDG